MSARYMRLGKSGPRLSTGEQIVQLVQNGCLPLALVIGIGRALFNDGGKSGAQESRLSVGK